jgi:hypothetical protein
VRAGEAVFVISRKLWHPMLPAYGRGKAWDELEPGERIEVAEEHPDWNDRELAAARWERIPLPSGVTVRAGRDLDFDGVRVARGSLGVVVRHVGAGEVRIAWFDSKCDGAVNVRVDDIEAGS